MSSKKEKAPQQGGAFKQSKINDTPQYKTKSRKVDIQLTKIHDYQGETICWVKIPLVGKKTKRSLIAGGNEINIDFILMCAEYLSFLCGDKPRQLKILKDINNQCYPQNGISPFHYLRAAQIFGNPNIKEAKLKEIRDNFVGIIFKPNGEPIDD